MKTIVYVKETDSGEDQVVAMTDHPWDYNFVVPGELPIGEGISERIKQMRSDKNIDKEQI